MNYSKRILGLGLALTLTAPTLAACDDTSEKRKIRPQPVWSSYTPKPTKRPKGKVSIRPTKTPPCSPGDKRIMCPR